MTNPIKVRILLAALTLSAAGFVGIVSQEGYEPVARPPVAGDVATNGFGSTGPDIRLGDKTDPVKAVQRAQRDILKFEGALKTCVKVPLHQHEYDSLVSLAYNIGPAAFCASTLVKVLNLQMYDQACAQIDEWVYFKGKKLPGLVKRRARERALCEGKGGDTA